MKTIKVSEATNIQLDWLVARCSAAQKRTSYVSTPKGKLFIKSPLNPVGRMKAYGPTTDWSLIGPIIEREDIAVIPTGDAERWESRIWQEAKLNFLITYGLTPLIAAARCFVSSKLGDTAEVPEELS